MEELKWKWQKMKPAELRDLAMELSTPSLKYKKTVHGKNKETLIQYLTAIHAEKEFSPDPQLQERLVAMDKEVLLQHCRQFCDYRKSFDRKNRDFHIDFLLRKNVDLSAPVASESNEKLKNLLSHKKEELIVMARKLPSYRPNIDRKGKEFLATFIMEKMDTDHTENGGQLMMMSLKELKEIASKNPLYNEKSFGKTKADLLSFIQNHGREGTAVEEDEPDAVSPVNLQDFFVQPNPEELRDALTKILTSHQVNLI